MQGLISFYNKNRKGIWLTAIIIAFLLIILFLINLYFKNTDKENEVINLNQNKIETNNDKVVIDSNVSAITGDHISSEVLQSHVDVITNFIENCNQGNIEEAYNMLTDECKEEMFSTVTDFKTYYYANIFGGERVSFDIQNWVNNTYMVDIIPDMLSTGKANNGMNKQDYITIKKVNGEYKLNINNYIGRTEIKRDKEEDNVKITVNYKDVYMEYETYNITIENKSERDIKLDSLNSIDSIYLEDKNKIKYPAYNHEITKEMIEINSGNSKTIEIKFYNRFSSGRNITKLVFSDYSNGKYGENGKEQFVISI